MKKIDQFLVLLITSTADRVYSLFNGYIFTNGTILKFRLSPYQEPQAEGPILEVRNLPNHIDHNTLYDIFRPYGPLSICKPITEDGSHRGKALVQFFYRYHSDSSVSDLVSFFGLFAYFILNILYQIE